jgi:hypothetical protein
MVPRLVDEVQREVIVDRKLCQVDLTADLLVLRLNVRPRQIDPLLPVHRQEEGDEAAMSRMLVRLLLLVHLEALGAD